MKLRAQPPAAPRAPGWDEIELKLGVHDASRLEWTASVGLPVPRSERKYGIDLTIEIPAHLYPVHNVWEHKQTFTRLRSPTEEGVVRVDRTDLDELRRDTLGVAHRLKRLLAQVERDCSAPPDEGEREKRAAALDEAVLEGAGLVHEMRRVLFAPPSDASGPHIRPEARTEWLLADEYLSTQLLDFLGKAQQSIDRLGGKDDHQAWLESLRGQMASVLGAELRHRERQGWVNPVAGHPSELGRFVERASQLKKHFQDVLFLDVDAWMVDYKLRNWTGVVAASLAAAFWLGFTLLPIGPGARAGISVGTFAVLFAVTYALKDRIKELTRGWLAGRLTRLYGQRRVILRLPERLDVAHKLVAQASETFDVTSAVGEDLLNRDVGRTNRVVRLTYRLKMEVHGLYVLERAGLSGLKHVYRYDLSPVFSRLDDAAKQVPVLDAESRRVRFVEAPKEYRFPLKLTAHRPNAADRSVTGVLVVSKRGIERLEQLDGA